MIKELTPAEVQHIAKLAKLTLSEEEAQKFQKQLVKIFDYIDLIGEMEIGAVPETSHPTGGKNIFREDLVDNSVSLSQKEALKNAPETVKGYFKTKAIFD